MDTLIVIPARLESTRLPRKMLQVVGKYPLLHYVAQQVVDLDIAPVVVAIDDPALMDVLRHVRGLEGVVMTGNQPNGTMRVAAAVADPPYSTAQRIVNVQGDHLFVPAEAVHAALESLEQGFEVGTAAERLKDEDIVEASQVKVVVSAGRDAAVAFFRQAAWAPTELELAGLRVGLHLGVYAYTANALRLWSSSYPQLYEDSLGLEQAHALGRVKFGVRFIPHSLCGKTIAVDTWTDLKRAREKMSSL